MVFDDRRAHKRLEIDVDSGQADTPSFFNTALKVAGPDGYVKTKLYTFWINIFIELPCYDLRKST